MPAQGGLDAERDCGKGGDLTRERGGEQVVGHWIGGVTVEPSGGLAPIFNPTLGARVRAVRLATVEDVNRAVHAAAGALVSWAQLPAHRRARVMFRFKQLLEDDRAALAAIISEEHGKTLADAEGEVSRGIEVVEFACSAPQLLKGELSNNASTGVDTYSLLQPLGVVAGITPFNFPAMVPLWMFPIALVCGNTFVLKPSERDPSASIRLAELIQQAGLPDGVLNVLQGDKTAVDALLAHPGVSGISFVGSTPVARYIQSQAIAHGKRVQALGGAKNHMVILPDAELDSAVEALVGAAYGAAGERCMAISVAVVVGEQTAERLIERLRTRLSHLKIGPSDAPGVEMGPLVTEAHRARVREYIEAGEREGAQLLLDGRKVGSGSGGFFLGPTLFDRVQPHMRIYREEIFGPVLSVVRVPDYAAALELVNTHQYANGAAVFTRSGELARRFVQDAAAGMVGVNVAIPVPVAFHSFGGWRNSMFGEHSAYGMEGVRFYTRLKTVTQRWPDETRTKADFSMPT
jgi:malonate-semialdehyde dehydrogenase (acetylating) / methylmalonate-semialdehyde dehydrogenase